MRKKVSFLALLIILPAFLFVSSCKKNSPQMTNIQVKDAISRSMVKGAVVGIHRCSIHDFFCGLIAYRSNTTGNDGSCRFNQEDYGQAQSVTVDKKGYWPGFEPKTSLIEIYPEGWLRLRIIKGTSYPTTSQLRIIATSIPGGKKSILQVNTATDSSILLRCFGGTSNQINWFVETSSPFTQINNGGFLQNITRQDTVHAVLNY